MRLSGILPETRGGRAPKPLGFFAIFRFSQTSRRLRRRAKGRGRRGDFSMVRIRLARFALPRLGLGGSKSGVSCSPLVCRVRGTIENVRASAARPEAESIALRDHRLPENVNIEKVGRTRFFNLFRTVISFCRLVTTMVCKHCPREMLPPHLYKSGGNRL